VPLAIVAVVLMLVVAVVILGMRRRPRQDEGMQTFRRHIDALSPEARREVMRHIDALSPEARREVSDRARKHQEGRG
jgi:hypothetical protein